MHFQTFSGILRAAVTVSAQHSRHSYLLNTDLTACSALEADAAMRYINLRLTLTLTTTLVQWPFSSPIWVSWYQNTPFGISLQLRTMEVVVTTKAVRRAKLQSNHHHQPTPSFFLQTICLSRRPTNSVKALKGTCSPPNSPGGLHTKGSCLGDRGLPSLVRR